MIPEGWKAAVLGDDATLLSGQHILAEECSDVPGGLPYLTGPSDFQDGVIRVTKYVKNPKVMCQAGDLLVTIKGSGTGKLVLADSTYCISRQLAAVRPRTWWNPFVFHVLTSFQSRLQGDAAGLIPGLSRDDLLGLPFLLPPLPEQRKIADILTSVDEAFEGTQAVIEQLGVVKKAMMAELLTRGIPGRHTKFKMTEIGEVPESWDVVALGRLAANEQNSFVIGPFGSDLVVQDYCSEGVPVIFVRDVKPNALRWKSNVFVSPKKAEELRAHRASPGDVIITKMGLPAGVAAVYPEKLPDGIVTADIIRLRLDSNTADARYVSEALNGPYASQQVAKITGGQTRPKLTLRDYKTVQLLLPSLTEQRELAAVLSSMDETVDAELSELAQLLEVKSALMSVLLTGEVRVQPDEDAA